MLFYLILAVHIVLCVALVFLVLVQQGKGADLGAISGGSNTVFGAGGATAMITKITTGIAVAFMITSIMLAKQYASGNVGAPGGINPLAGSVMDGAANTEEASRAKIVQSEVVTEQAPTDSTAPSAPAPGAPAAPATGPANPPPAANQPAPAGQ